MHLINRYNKGIKSLIYVIDLYSKYTCIVSLKEKKCATVANALKKIIEDFKR